MQAQFSTQMHCDLSKLDKSESYFRNKISNFLKEENEDDWCIIWKMKIEKAR